MHRSWARAAAVAALVFGVVAMTIGGGATGAGADDPPGNVGDRAGAQNNGSSVTGNAQTSGPGSAAPPPGADDGSGGPNCTMTDGTPGYLRYEGLQVTTMEQQRTEIRPEEQRPGVYLHVYCNDQYVDFVFFPAGAPVVVNPWQLARSVTITPPEPVILTSPAPDDHLVGMTAWFWVDTWDDVRGGTSAGGVTVNVRAVPTTLTIDPGDGTGAFTCVDPQPYTPGGTSSCTHVYQRAGNVTATATLTYQTSFTSNVGAGGALGPIQAASSSQFTVSEAQAINT